MNARIINISILLAIQMIGGGNTNTEEELWCNQCNADSSEDRKAECNDPYTPAATDLVLCPRNESHLCLKSLIFYKNIHVTVRGCVPAKSKSTYCSFKEAYPEASLECLFCSDYACNTSPPSATSLMNRFLVISLITVVLAISYER